MLLSLCSSAVNEEQYVVIIVVLDAHLCYAQRDYRRVRLSICPSVRPLQAGIGSEKDKRNIMLFSPPGSLESLAFMTKFCT